MFGDDDLSCDAFLGGRLRLWQPRAGYRAGIDPVLLAAVVPARPGNSVLDLGCGGGVAGLCLATRVPGIQVTGVERQAAYAELARRNGAANAIEITVVTADLANLPGALKQMRFDHVIANPPYYDPARRSPAEDAGREAALAEDTPLAVWIEVAARRLNPRGYLHMIQGIDRLPAVLAACDDRLGSLEVLPLSARAGRAPELMILRARKGGRARFRLLAPLVLHDGDCHTGDGDSYTPRISAVFREAAALCWPGAQV